MRKHKYLLAQFTFYDRTGICRILEQQAQKGWLLDKVTNFGWRFKRIEPQKIHFAVTYYPKASAYDPHPSQAQQELHDFCAYSGWILAGTTAQMQVFYNLSENPVPIETDPVLELENIHASAKKNYLPAYFMLLILAIAQIGLQVGQLLSFPLTYLSQDTVIFNWLCELTLFAMCAMEIGGYFAWYRKAKPAAENGEFVETRGFRKISLFLLTVVITALIWLLCSMSPRMATGMGVILVILSLVYLAVFGVQRTMKRQGIATKTNRAITLVLTFVITMVICFLTVPVVGKIMELPVWEENRDVRQFEWNGHYFDIYNDDLPLRVEDLADVFCPDYSYEAREQSSPLLKKGDYSQRIWGSSEYPEMSYIIYTTNISSVYDLVVREATASMDHPAGAYENGELFYDEYMSQDATPWGADVAYRRYAGGESYNHFVLCYENKVVIFQPDWELTPEQMATVGTTFGK